jgi:hypothetical protein
MKKYLFLLLLLSSLALSGCGETLSVEGIVAETFLGACPPKLTGGPYTFIRFADGRFFAFEGLSPEPLEINRYNKVYYNNVTNRIIEVEIAIPPRPKIPGEMQ